MKGRSILAVVTGILFVFIVSTVVDNVLHATGVLPPAGEPMDDKLSLLATAYRFLITVAAAWLTAKLAPQNPMKHALILGVIGTVLGLVGVITTWNPSLAPRWYAIALMVLALPQCWLGGKLYEMQARRPAQA